MVRFWNTEKYVFRLILSFVLLFECGKKEIVFVTVVMLYLIVEPSHTYDVRTRPHHVWDTFLSCTCTLSKNLFYGTIINDSSSALACGVTCYTYTYAPLIYRGLSQILLSFVNHSITFFNVFLLLYDLLPCICNPVLTLLQRKAILDSVRKATCSITPKASYPDLQN